MTDRKLSTTDATETPAEPESAIDRREDVPLLTGEARYVDDIQPPRAVHMAVLRSRMAHAEIESVDTSGAESHDGVHAVYTSDDIEASGVPGGVPPGASLPDPDGSDVPMRIERPLSKPAEPLLASDRVRYVGEPIAVVLASDRYAAHDARDMIEVEYDRREALTDPREAAADGAEPIHDGAEDNVAFVWGIGDRDAADEAFEDAANTVSVEFGRQRMLSNPMETRGAVAEYSRSTGQLTVWRPSQGPHVHQANISETLGLALNKVRVVSPDVGGSFGTKSKPYAGEMLTAWCAMQTDRPVRWKSTRSEAHLSDAHGRAHDSRAELAFDDDGTLRGLRVRTHADMGAYVRGPAPKIHTRSLTNVLSGLYTIPAIDCRVTGVFTTTTPVSSYRSTSRPRAILLLERLVDLAADRLDVDPAELRRRNLIDEFPYRTAVGTVYDSGDYEATLDHALETIGYDRLRERQAELREQGRYLGIGVSCSVHDVRGVDDVSGNVRFLPSGDVVAAVGTFDTGQGHRTTFAQLLADDLGVPYESIEVKQGDTDDLVIGSKTGGSRSVVMVSGVLDACTDRIVEKGRRVAAHALEASEDDIEFEDGEFTVRGAPDRSIDIQEVARLAYDPGSIPDGLEPGLETTATVRSSGAASNSTHVAVAEVDPETGEVDLNRYLAVDDCGTRVNPRLVAGQVHGAVAQGIGQALYEEAVYDDTGNLLTGSMQDYVMPKAFHVPDIDVEDTVTPAPDTAHGVKGISESGTTAAPAAVTNAVMDALAPFDVENLDLPITPERVWRAL